MNNELKQAETEVIKAEDYGLEIAKTKQMASGLVPILAERDELMKSYLEVIDLELNEENVSVFRELRLKYQRNRTQGIVAWHKKGKEVSLRESQWYDAKKKQLIAVNIECESKLLNGEQHYENLEKERISKLQTERASLLSEFVEDASERDLSGMDEDVWDAYFNTKKKEYNDKVAAENKAKEERIAQEKGEAEERERIRKENERLKKEAEEREIIEAERQEKQRKAEAERAQREALEVRKIEAKAKAERKDREEKDRKQKEEFEAKLQAERDEKERIEREERAKREKLEAELEAKAEAERIAKEEQEAIIQAELNKGDSDKIQDLISDLNSVKSKYVFKSNKNKKLFKEVTVLLDNVVNHIQK